MLLFQPNIQRLVAANNIDGFIRATQHPDAEIRSAAVSAQNRFKNHDVNSALLMTLRDQHKNVRIESIIALGKFKEPSSIHSLEWVLKDSVISRSTIGKGATDGSIISRSSMEGGESADSVKTRRSMDTRDLNDRSLDESGSTPAGPQKSSIVRDSSNDDISKNNKESCDEVKPDDGLAVQERTSEGYPISPHCNMELKFDFAPAFCPYCAGIIKK